MTEAFVARQPIFDRQMRVYGYELLYRAEPEDQWAAIQDAGEAATSTVLVNWATGVGMEQLTGGRMAFVNVSRAFLFDLEHVAPAPFTVALEIPAVVQNEPELVSVVQELAAAGYSIALDDFQLDTVTPELLEAADLVKVDVLAERERPLEELVEEVRGYPVQLLAEKVENAETLERCKELGFHFFQGFFFTRPQTVAHRDLPADRVQLIRLLGRLQDPEATLDELAEVVAHDVYLSYRLLRLVNSPFFPTRVEVDSIHRAVSLLGLESLRTYVSWLAMTRIDDKPSELTKTLMVRARLCALLAEAMGRMDFLAAFTVGLFSGLDALTDLPLEEALEPLPLSEAVRDALLQRSGPLGDILSAVVKYEQGDWSAPETVGLAPTRFHEAYLNAVAWAEDIESSVG